MNSPGNGADQCATVVTLTMNPALDITTAAAVVRPTDKIRCTETRYDPGGGGINVARVARVLGASVAAVFPAGGPTGALVSELVAKAAVPLHRIDIAESTRESFTVDETSTGRQYRFVLRGPHLTAAEQAECLDQLRRAAASAEFVVASGSLPIGVSPEFYQQVADVCVDLGALLILDTSGCGLAGVTHGAFVMKPSLRELREYVGRPLDTDADQVVAAQELIERGVTQAVVVSLGSAGALMVTSTACLRFSAIPVQAVSGVGAGDAMVAGITVGLSRAWPLSDSVRLGIAAATAMLMTPGTATPTRADVERLHDMVSVPTELDAAHH
ncbi:1-phosphofructokinase family hexose kinase [Mycolicibacterium sp. P9-64]|uniref:1-phosphofructokinase family hexose kinase n=1 Tax=Mycolicibacterium sp. P9-64 TaxID=2024612 RepID=UPI0011F0618D|nr:1-phosphofructokinase family hexose kinase [Mycolicibacterium sp. P9-64]KAA0079515.1 1-phosphofructokinase family hexose kinase [Mycolicibacterium sp. P9-64]